MLEATNNTVGFYIMRVDSPDMAVVTRSRRLVRAEDNKENIPPSRNVGSPAAWRRRQRMKRSPLPHWHPRTPLRDITVIYNALQQRRLREEAAQADSTRANRGTDASPATNPKVPDDSTPAQNPGCNAVEASPPAMSQPVSTPCTTTADFNTEAEEIEKKLTKSIDQIEKMVNKAYNLNAKKNLKVEMSKRSNVQKKTLMSMR